MFTFFTGTRELNSPYVACVPADMDLSTISCLRDSDCSFGLSCQDWQCRPATARARTRKRIRWLADGSDLCWPIHLLSSIERGCFRLSELPHLPYFYPLSSSSLRLLKNPKSAVNFTNSERPFNFAQVNQKPPIWWTGMYARLLIWCFWWKVWFILLNSGTLFWFLLFYIMFT